MHGSIMHAGIILPHIGSEGGREGGYERGEKRHASRFALWYP